MENPIEQKNPNFQKEVARAFETLNPEQAFSALKDLDKYLTGATNGTFATPPDATVNEVRQEIANAIKKIQKKEDGRLVVYLSGGSARVYVDFDKEGKVTLKLRDDGPEEVIKKWESLEK